MQKCLLPLIRKFSFISNGHGQSSTQVVERFFWIEMPQHLDSILNIQSPVCTVADLDFCV